MTVRHSYDRNSLCCLTKWSKTCCLTSRSHFGRQAQVNTRFLSNPVKIYVRLYELLIYFHVNYTDMFSKQIYWIDILPRNMKPVDCRMFSFYWIISLKLSPTSHQLTRCQHQHSWLLWSPDGRWRYLNLSPLSSPPSKKDTSISPTAALHPDQPSLW